MINPADAVTIPIQSTAPLSVVRPKTTQAPISPFPLQRASARRFSLLSVPSESPFESTPNVMLNNGHPGTRGDGPTNHRTSGCASVRQCRLRLSVASRTFSPLPCRLKGGRVMRCQHVNDDIQCRIDATRRVLVVWRPTGPRPVGIRRDDLHGPRLQAARPRPRRSMPLPRSRLDADRGTSPA